MSSNDNIENDCNGQVDDLEKESRKKNSCSECDKVFLHPQDTGSHTSLININTKTKCHSTMLQ